MRIGIITNPDGGSVSHLDERGLRVRLCDWDDDHLVAVPAGLVRGIIEDLDEARRQGRTAHMRGEAARDSLVVWANAVTSIAEAMGVKAGTGDDVESIKARIYAAIADTRDDRDALAFLLGFGL